MLTHEEKIAKLVSKKGATLEDKGTTRSKLRIILHDCGWKKRGSGNLLRIQAAFEAAGIYPEPMLTAPGLDWEEMIYFSREKPEPYFPEWYAPQHAFSSESALQRFLIANFDRIPQFKNLRHPVAEAKLPSNKRIDILCRERKSNAFMVIELKKHDVDPVDQLREYLEEVDTEFAQTANERLPVKGMIITGEPNAALERSLPDRIPNYPVQWFLYRAEVKLYRRAKSEL